MKRPVHRLCDTLWFSLSTTCAGLSSPTPQVSLLELSDGKHHGIGQLGGQDSVAGAQLEVVRGGVRRWRVRRDFEEEKKLAGHRLRDCSVTAAAVSIDRGVSFLCSLTSSMTFANCCRVELITSSSPPRGKRCNGSLKVKNC